MEDDAARGRFPRAPESGRAWRAGLAAAALAAGVYVLLRPPLFNFDGCMYRLQSLGPFAAENLNPHHLLWYPVERALAALLAMTGSGGPRAFQLFGIAVSSLVLVVLYRLLWRSSGSGLYALLGTMFVAASPKFWFFTMQNQPYPATYLFTALYLHCWYRPDGGVPDPRRLTAAGISIAAAIFFQQGMAVLVPAGVLTLMLRGGGGVRRRVARALLWGAGTTAFVLAGYILVGWPVGFRDPAAFLDWTTGYLKTQHSLQVELPDSVAKSFIGILRSVVPMSGIEAWFGACCSYAATLRVFGVAALAAALLAAFWLRRSGAAGELPRLARTHAFFCLTVTSTVAWAALVFAWEPLGYYWGLSHIPLLALIGIVVRARPRPPSAVRAAAATAVVVALTAVNLAANHDRDLGDAVNTPEVLLASIDAALGPGDLLVVLGREWFDGTDFDLLFEYLDARGDDRGRAILHDYVMNPEADAAWQARVGREVDDVLDRGGRVFVARHLFAPEAFADLMQVEDPFSEYAHEEYAAIDGTALQEQVAACFAAYRLVPAALRVGGGEFLELRRVR